MIEKNPGYKSFQKKIIPYLDGSLAPEETAEFEAFVLTHPEFEDQIKSKQEEIELIRNMIPFPMMTKDSIESLETEMRSSIFNLLKEEPKGILDILRIKWEEWTNR